jgi:hypothetical protein
MPHALSRRSCSRSRLGIINCPQHIPRKLDAVDVADAIARLEARIAFLEAENSGLKTRLRG